MMAGATCSYKVAGFEVHFPHQAYGVQKVFMNQVLRAIDHEGNALLEAPTGCGKTLSLLCGALAWQTAQKQKKAAAEQAKAEVAQQRKAAEEAKPPNLAALGKEVDNSGATSDVDSPDAAAEVEEEDEPIVVPRIYYATRTHSQIAQVVRELKRTAYRPKMAVLGSRPHYCINNSVIRSGSIDAGCEELNKEERGCPYKKNANSISHGLVQVHDIEDLHKIGKRHKACPYFAARHLADSAELVFCPYSYLLDPNIRRATKVIATDAILVFDEAHNIEDQAREAGSMDLDLEQLKETYIALNLAASMSTEADTYRPLADAVLRVIQWLMALAESGTQSAGFRPAGFERFERIWAGQQMLSALAEAGLGVQDVEHLWAMYEKARAAEDKAGFNAEGDAGLEPVDASIKSPKAGGAALGCVSTLLTVLRLLYGTYSEAPSPEQQEQQLQQQQQLGSMHRPGSAKAGASAAAAPAPKKLAAKESSGDYVPDYRMAVQMWVPREQNRRDRRDRRRAPPLDTADAFSAAVPGTSSSGWGLALGLWCLNPAVVFKSLSNVARSVLLASGTLSPLDSFSGELGLTFHVKLEAPHVVDMKRQVLARVVSHGPDGRLMNATFKEADKLDYQDSLGKLTLAVAQAVPDGVLLFLPSYSLMDKLKERWKVTGVWHQLNQLKLVITEPRKAGDDFDDAIAQYYKAVADGRGGLFMAVCRGKASEGIDFADGNARCVMVVGIPFPNVKDTKVGLKKDYNNSAAAASAGAAGRGGSCCGRAVAGRAAAAAAAAPPRLLTGDSWYSQQAFRALNQAVGRCIRHRLDYGAILLVDERFRQPRNQQSLSKWVRSAVSTASNTNDLLKELRGFFQGLAANPPGSEAFVNQQQQAQQQQQQRVAPAELSKPGYEAATAAAAALIAEKPGFEVAAADPSTCKPGWQPSLGADMCCSAGKAGDGPGCGMHPDAAGHMTSSKPGCEPAWSVAMGCGAGKAVYESSTEQGGTATGGCCDGAAGAAPAGQHQQHQQAKQQACRRLSGPMDAFVVKTEQQQQQLDVNSKQTAQDCNTAMLILTEQQQQQTSESLKREQQACTSAAPQRNQQLTCQLHKNSAAAAAAGQQAQLAARPARYFTGTCGISAADVQVLGAQQQQQQAGGMWQQQQHITPGWGQHQQQQPGHCAGYQQQEQQQSWPPNNHATQQQHANVRQPTSCMNMLTGHAATPPLQPQQLKWQQQQHQPWPQQQQPQQHWQGLHLQQKPGAAACIKPGHCSAMQVPQQLGATAGNAPAAVAATAGKQPAAVMVNSGAVAAGSKHEPAANCSADTVAAPVPAGAITSMDVGAASAPCQQDQQQAGTAAAAAAAVAPAGARGPTSCDSSGLSTALEQLGLQLPVLQQWVAGDIAAMRQQLHSQGVTDRSHGHTLLQLASFGILAALQLAHEHCHMSQQQQQHARDNPDSSSSSSLASFWRVWHSHIPSGLLAAAAASGEHVPAQHQARASGLWSAVSRGATQQRGLAGNLHLMADAYDAVLDSFCDQQQQQQQCHHHHHQEQQQQQQQQQCHYHHQEQQQQQQQHWQKHPCQLLGQQNKPQHQYQQEQQPPWQQHQHQLWQQQPPCIQKHQQHQHKQQQQQPWPQQQQQWPPHKVCHAAASTACPAHPARNTNLLSSNSSRQAAALPAAPGPRVLQLSQSARQPKRAAHPSGRAQLAAQKRSRLQQQQQQQQQPMPAANASSRGTIQQ